MNENGEMILEAHFQEFAPPYRTVLLERGAFSNAAAAVAWAEAVFLKRIFECPDGYGPMVSVPE
jgi:hypothetical protein